MGRSETGRLGEKLAGAFLKSRGYEIVETNYRCSAGEIDIVARQKDCLVFIEVRTKKSAAFGGPEESITCIKKEHLRAAVAHYLQERQNLPDCWRIDVVAVELDKKSNPSRIEIIENAVEED